MALLFHSLMLGFIPILMTSLSGATVAHLLPRALSNPEVFTSIPSSTNLTWTNCLEGAFCAILDVPLDYAVPSGTRSHVPLLRYPATATPYKGMVMMNPGGPGFSAIEDLILNHDFYASTVGTNYDLVAMEPRGIGYSTPKADCGPSTFHRAVRRHIKPFGSRLPDKFFADEYAYGQDLGTRCTAAIGGPNDAGQHMSTAIVVQDLISTSDAYSTSSYSDGVPNKTLLNFWGFSYGTIIGQTFASMYPHRVGRVVLDGVLDAADYMSAEGLKYLQFTDEAFASFFVFCNLAGPAACPYHTGSSALDIFHRFKRTVSQLNAKEALDHNWANGTSIYLGLQALKLIVFRLSYYPISSFQYLSQYLLFFEGIVKNIQSSDIVDLETLAGAKLSLHPPGSDPQASPAVVCTDTGNILLGRSLLSFKPTRIALQLQSWVAGEIFGVQGFSCTKWAIAGIGRFTGPFGGNTKNPILFVSNTRDPVAPIHNGQKARLLFRKSRLLTIDGTGHTSIGSNNVCGFAKIKDYFQTGALPGLLSNSCPLEEGPFGVTAPSGTLRRDGDVGTVMDAMRRLRAREARWL